MIPIAKMFLMNEIGPFDWMRMSIASQGRQNGQVPPIKVGRPSPTAAEKVKTDEIKTSYVPKPISDPKTVGYKPSKIQPN